MNTTKSVVYECMVYTNILLARWTLCMARGAHKQATVYGLCFEPRGSTLLSFVLRIIAFVDVGVSYTAPWEPSAMPQVI